MSIGHQMMSSMGRAPFIPLPDIPTGPPIAGYAAWWDASDTTTITGGAAVSQWNDKSVGGFNLTQAVAGLKPSSGTRTLNGLNVVDFDGGDTVSRAAGDFAFTSTTTTCAVIVPDVLGAALHTIISGAGATVQALMIDTTDKPYITAGTPLLGGAVLVAATAVQLTGKLNGASSQVYINGTGGGAGNAGGGTDGGGITVGGFAGAFALDGAIAEMVVYATALSDADRQAVEAYLKAKWATP